MRTILNPTENSALDSSTMRAELQTLEAEIANTSTGHDHDGSDSKAILPASLPSAIDAAKIADGSVSNAEFQYLNGVTSAIQTQFTGKETAGATATHSALTTGVHGVGAGTVAKTSDITATKLDDFATPDDNTDLNANTTNHGLLLKATAPASGLINVVGIANGETAYTNKALFDATVPSTQAFGDAAAAGSATVSARRDHKHAMPAAEKDTTAITGVLKGNGSAISAASQGTDYYAPSGTDVAVVDGGTGASTASGALTNLGIKIVRKTADETVNNNNTLQDDDALLFAIGASEIWSFQMYVRTNWKAASDFKFTITVPSGATGGFNAQNSSMNTTNEFAFASSQALASTSDQTTTVRLMGVVVNSTNAGNVTFQWSQDTAVAEDTKVLANSYIIAIKLA